MKFGEVGGEGSDRKSVSFPPNNMHQLIMEIPVAVFNNYCPKMHEHNYNSKKPKQKKTTKKNNNHV